MLDSEQELNALDAANADGDLGRNMARAAQCLGGESSHGNPWGKLHDECVRNGSGPKTPMVSKKRG